MFDINYSKYSHHYDEKKIIEKMKKATLIGGKKLIYAALLLYYTLQKDNVPLKAKSVIIGALGYLIAPFDLIPDLLPILGYTDDFGALMMALALVTRYIDDEVKHKARTKLGSWFAGINDSDIIEVESKL